MAERANAVVVLTTGGKLEVQETPGAVKNRIDGATGTPIALAELTDRGGTTHWINVAAIVEFYEEPTYRSVPLA